MGNEKMIKWKALRLATIILFTLFGIANADGISICAPSANFWETYVFGAALASLAVFLLVGIAYMAGQTIANARLLVWAKTEAYQAGLSVAIVWILIFCLSTLCVVNIGEIGAMTTNLPSVYSDYKGANAYEAGVLYLQKLSAFALSNIASLRYDLAIYEFRTSFSSAEDCSWACLISFSNIISQPYSGESSNIAIINSQLSIATVSYLTSIFQYFTLAYIYNGLFVVFLPIAIVVRSIPFMRQFGGALIGIFIALYLFYPFMLILDSYIVPSFASAGSIQMYGHDRKGICEGKEIFGSAVSCTEHALAEKDVTIWPTQGAIDKRSSSMDSLPNAIKTNALIFVASVFLPAVNFIVTGALARDISRFLGDEADISRLGQMV